MDQSKVVFEFLFLATIPFLAIPLIISIVRKVERMWLVLLVSILVAVGMYKLFGGLYCMLFPPSPWDMAARKVCTQNDSFQFSAMGCLLLYAACLVMSIRLKGRSVA